MKGSDASHRAGSEPAVVVFDGLCNVCDGTVRFLIDHDPAARFRFASLQSGTGRALLGRHGLDADVIDSVVVVDGDRAYLRSAAAIRILRLLPAPWPMLSVLWIIPRPLRDAAYDWFARNRYRWFGRREGCRVPDDSVRERFLEEKKAEPSGRGVGEHPEGSAR